MKSVSLLLLFVFGLLFAQGGLAQPPATLEPPPAAATEMALPAAEAEADADEEQTPAEETEDTLGRLIEIREQIIQKREELESLRAEVKREKREEQLVDIKRRIEELPASIDALNHSFEQIAIGGVDLEALEEQQEDKFNWQDELVQITKPLFASLKELTEKPRKIEHLRTEAYRHEQQLRLIGKALETIESLRQRDPPKSVAERLESLEQNWRQRQTDANHALEVVNYQLATLQGESISSLESVLHSLGGFFRGRGLTLAIALASVLMVWLLSRLLLAWVVRFIPSARADRKAHTRAQAVRYLYRVGTGLAMLIALIVVFYTRSDLLLLALTIIAVVMLAISVKQALPKYLREIRILLDFGSVREGERINVNGVPLRVEAINTFAFLRNPELEGLVRLPLETITEMVSRPVCGEPWFPTRAGEQIMFPDGRMAEVLSQSVEIVRLRAARGIVEYPTAAFLGLQLRNLSREGFGIPVTFGIDYRHQAICLDRVPMLMERALRQALAHSEHAPHLADVLVEFKEAGAHSLDYLVYLSLHGEAAPAYHAIIRLVQRTLVALCNREGWGIPFQQLTIHRGDGFAGPCAEETKAP